MNERKRSEAQWIKQIRVHLLTITRVSILRLMSNTQMLEFTSAWNTRKRCCVSRQHIFDKLFLDTLRDKRLYHAT